MFKRPLRPGGAIAHAASTPQGSPHRLSPVERKLTAAKAVAPDAVKPAIELKERLEQMRKARLGR